MITRKSTYDEIVKEINDSAAEVLQDAAYDGMELSEDEVWADLATSYLLDADRTIAEEVCRCQLGYVPGQLQDRWERERLALLERHAATVAAAKARAQARKEKIAQDRKTAAHLAREAERDRIRANTCPECRTLRSPNGACFC